MALSVKGEPLKAGGERSSYKLKGNPRADAQAEAKTNSEPGAEAETGAKAKS